MPEEPAFEGATSRSSAVEQAPLSFGIFALSRALHGYGTELLMSLGLHPGQELILMQLLDRDGQSQAELQRAVGLNHSTVSRSIRRMQDAGLLSRAPAPRDRRAVTVQLTKKGLALREPLKQLWGVLEKTAASPLSIEDQHALVRMSLAVEQALVSRRRAADEAFGPT